MKNAPSLKYQPKDKFTEVIIFAGTDAYAHAQHWIESEGRKHGDNVPPVYRMYQDEGCGGTERNGLRFARG